MIKLWVYFEICISWIYLILFAYVLVSTFAHCSLFGSLCSAAVIFQTLASLAMLVNCLALQRIRNSTQSLLIMVTYHALICGMHELLYVYHIIFFSADLFRSIIFVFAYNSLNILMGNKLPSLPVFYIPTLHLCD